MANASFWHEKPEEVALANYMSKGWWGRKGRWNPSNALTLESLTEYDRERHNPLGSLSIERQLGLNIAVYTVLGLLDRDRLDDIYEAWLPKFKRFKLAALKSNKELFALVMPPARFRKPDVLDRLLFDLCEVVGRYYNNDAYLRITNQESETLSQAELMAIFSAGNEDVADEALVGFEDCDIYELLHNFTPEEQLEAVQYLSPWRRFTLNPMGLSDYLLMCIFKVYKGHSLWDSEEEGTLIFRGYKGRDIEITRLGDWRDMSTIEEAEEQSLGEGMFRLTGFCYNIADTSTYTRYMSCRIRYELDC